MRGRRRVPRPVTGSVPENVAAQVDLALDRLSAVLKAAGLSNANMVFVNPYLTSDIPMRIMNEHYARIIFIFEVVENICVENKQRQNGLSTFQCMI